MNLTADHFLALRRSPLLRGVPDIAVEALLNEGTVMRCSSGYLVFQDGDIGDEAYFILDGQVGIKLQAPGGEYILRRTLDRGMLLGEIALFTGGRRSATAEVINNAELLRISREMFTNLIQAWPQIAIALLGALSERLIEAEVSARN